MEAQLQRTSPGHHSNEQDSDHHEKKSVLKKVKDKAKKIQNTIKKHGHEHEEHKGGYGRETNYPQGYEDEKQDMVNDPQDHGAPMYESSVIRSRDIPRETQQKPGGTLQRHHNVRNEEMSRPSGPGQRRPAMQTAREPENKTTHFPTSGHTVDRGHPNVRIGAPMGLDEDPHSPMNTPAQTPPSNYQSKVTDPTGTGGKEAEAAPLASQFGNIYVHDASATKPESGQRASAELNPNRQGPIESEDVPQDTIMGKISSATAAITDKAVFAKNVLASKMGYGGSTQEGQDSSGKPALQSVTEYAHEVTEKPTPVYEKVGGAGTAVMSKGDEHRGRDKGAAMGEYLAEKFRPGDDDKVLSEAITDTLQKKIGTGEEEHQMGKVTQSEEVTAHLGPAQENKREGQDAFVSGAESSGQGVAERVKDAVSSWLGKSTGIQTAQDSVGQSYVSEAGSASSGIGPGGGGA